MEIVIEPAKRAAALSLLRCRPISWAGKEHTAIQGFAPRALCCHLASQAYRKFALFKLRPKIDCDEAELARI